MLSPASMYVDPWRCSSKTTTQQRSNSDVSFPVPGLQAGCCFLQQHEARYQWIHGVPELHRGERLSVTWRWFLDDVELEGTLD